MTLIRNIRYVRLGTRDLDAATRFATRIVGLQEAGRVGTAGAVYFRSDTRHHTLVYFEGDPTEQIIAFEVEDTAALKSPVLPMLPCAAPIQFATKRSGLGYLERAYPTASATRRCCVSTKCITALPCCPHASLASTISPIRLVRLMTSCVPGIFSAKTALALCWGLRASPLQPRSICISKVRTACCSSTWLAPRPSATMQHTAHATFLSRHAHSACGEASRT